MDQFPSGQLDQFPSGAIIALFGGSGNNDVIASIDAYDPVQATWKTLTALPTPRQSLGCWATPEQVVVAGGRAPTQQGNKQTDQVEIYDVKAGTWTVGPLLPHPRGLVGSAGRGDRGFLLGGLDKDEKHLASAVQLVVGGGWSDLTSLPEATASPAVGIVGERLFLFGGLRVDGWASSAFSLSLQTLGP